MIIPILLTLLLSVIHFYFEDYAKHLRRLDILFISFSSGLFISYIFLGMFPQIVSGHKVIGDFVYLLALWGFVILHIVEKYIYQHTNRAFVRLKRLVMVRTTGFFINHFILGMAIVFFFQAGSDLTGYFAFIPILFHTMTASLVSEHLHHRVRATMTGKILSSGSIFFGAIFAVLINLTESLFAGLFSFITGMLLYLVVRDTMPSQKEGHSNAFILGAIIYLVIVVVERIVTSGSI